MSITLRFSTRRFRKLRQSTFGLTLVEVLVTLAVIAILLTLLFPAIQTARENARRLSCQSHLRQVTQAINGHFEAQNTIPVTYSSFLEVNRLLPYLGEVAIADQIQTSIDDPTIGYDFSTPNLLLCPSDENVHREERQVNLAVNLGWRYFDRPFMNGLVPAYSREANTYRLSWKDVSDGLSNTACVSERLCHFFDSEDLLPTTEELAADPLRNPWYTANSMGDDGDEVAFSEVCRSQRTSPFFQPMYVSRNLKNWPYSHLLPPNSAPCVNGPRTSSVLNAFDMVFRGITPATSRHSGGVNAALCDGAVRFVSQTIDGEVWRRIGARNDGLTASLD